MSKQTQMTVKTETALTLTDAMSGFNPENIVLPTMTIRQNTFQKAELKPFRSGDVVTSPDYKKIASEDEAVHVVPVQIDPFYKITRLDPKTSREKMVRFDRFVANLPEHFEEDGNVCRREQVYVGHVILVEQLAKQKVLQEAVAKGEIVDPSDFVLPTRIIFSRSSRPSAKILLSHFETSKIFRQTPAAFVFALKTTPKTNDKGNWFAFDISKVTDAAKKYTPKEHLDLCNFWVGVLGKAKTLKVSEETELSDDETLSKARHVGGHSEIQDTF